MSTEDTKPSLDELVHFGVKGMKWGVRKAEPINSSYSSRMQANDKRQHGSRAVRRINKRLNAGETRTDALRREEIRNHRQALIASGALYMGFLLAKHGDVIIPGVNSYIVNRANQNRQAARLRDSTIAIGSTATKTPFIKPSRGGVYNITTKK